MMVATVGSLVAVVGVDADVDFHVKFQMMLEKLQHQLRPSASDQC